MKYSKSNPPLVCMQTNSTCYKGTSTMTVKGVLWHSTGANNKTIKRYVQPSENDPNYSTLIAKIGKNTGGNDWNHISMQAGLNAWVGTLADGSVATVQTMPWNYKPWGCGSGSRGSCNSGWIQWEICEDNLSDPNYFAQIYKESCELTAYLCSLYGLNPKGSVNYNGITVPVILCHQDSYQLGLGTNHGDVYHWFKKYGKDMNSVREDVAALLSGAGISVPATSGSSSSSGGMPETSPGNCLGKGDYSKAVQKLQQNLIKLGYSCGASGADGDFGAGTDAAVRKFQADHGLTVDGLVGADTERAIQEALSGKTTSTPTTTTSSGSQMYRVRKSWADAKSQVGAYTVLNNAKAACDKAGSAYKVYDNSGNQVYPGSGSGAVSTPTQPQPSTPSSTKPAPATKYSDVKLGYASKDENGRYTGGADGDQTGNEVRIASWYDSGWDVILRPNDATLAEAIAAQCENACNNNYIGYDQGDRNDIYTEAKKVGLQLGSIRTYCDCDCSSLVSACCIAAGLPASSFYDGNLRITSNMERACIGTGKFTALRDAKYLRQKNYLKRGDIVLNSNSHVAICLADGASAENTASATQNQTNGGIFLAKITANVLNVRADASESAKVTTTVKKNQIFTIVATSGNWGKLKSGAGWIDLTYTQKV